MTRNSKDFTIDANLELRDAGLVTADAASLVDSAAKIIDLGTGRTDFRIIVDMGVVEVATTDEILEIICQVSSSSTFASTIKNVAILRFSALAVQIGGADAGAAIGRYELHGCNEINGTIYRYLRLYENYTGTIDTGFNFTAWLVKQ